MGVHVGVGRGHVGGRWGGDCSAREAGVVRKGLGLTVQRCAAASKKWSSVSAIVNARKDHRCIIVTFKIKIRVRVRLASLKFGRLQIRLRLGL